LLFAVAMVGDGAAFLPVSPAAGTQSEKNRDWDALHARGLDISAGGKGPVASEKYRSLHRSACQGAQDNCF
jgi:hypothetical protein